MYSFQKSVKHSSGVLISRQHLTPLQCFLPPGSNYMSQTGRVPQTAEMCKEVGNASAHTRVLFQSDSRREANKPSFAPAAGGRCWHPAGLGGGKSEVGLSGPRRKTPPRALIATTRSRPEALSSGGSGCASRQFASFYRSVIRNGRPGGNLKC